MDRVWDVNGTEYVDYLLGSGPMIVGHAHPEVVEVAQAQTAKGTTFFANNEHGIRLAAEIVDTAARSLSPPPVPGTDPAFPG